MSEVLLWFAALIPTASGLLVAARALVRHRASTVLLARISEIEATCLRETRLRMDEGVEHPEWLPRVKRRNALQRLGITYTDYTGDASARSLMRMQSLTTAEQADQWVLIGSASSGVVLLALSLIV